MRLKAVLLSTIVSGSALSGSSLSAQTNAPPAVTPKAMEQIRQVEKDMMAVASTDSARAAGFNPMFGWIPTMGTHWVNPRIMMVDRKVAMAKPSQIMFSPIGGKETLVGAAFAYLTTAADSTRPNLFDGNPPWHDHPDLAPPGTNVVMLHVWFVPSPDGPFAGHNPFLPFWAVGLTPPDTMRMRDPAVSKRVRKAALALAEIADSAGVFPQISRRPAVRTVLDEHRAAIRALVPKIEAARGDTKAWDSLIDELGKHWDPMAEAYLKSAVNPQVNKRMVDHIESMLSTGHGAHHH
jgi:hypothetical protein